MTDHDIDIDLRQELAGGALDEAPSGQTRARGPGARTARTRPARRASREASGSREGAVEATALDRYLSSLGAPRVLSREETYELARTLEKEREAFLTEIYAIPGTAVKLVDRWTARRRSGHVTALLSARYRDASGKDRGPEIDRALARLERLLAQRERLVDSVGRNADRQRTELEERIARASRAAGIAFEVMQEVYKELQALRGAPRSRATREARRRLGLHEPAHRARLERARRALERMDRVKQTFVVHNLRLVMKQAKRFRRMGVPYLDLVQDGNLGLIRAVEKFDYRLGYKFSTYAVWWIDQALVRAVQNASRTVRVPTHVYDLQVRMAGVRERLRTQLARAPSPQELAEAMGVTAEQVEWAARSMQTIVSTQATLPGTEEFSLEDALADEEAADPIQAIQESELGLRLGRRLAALDPREAEIIDARYGLSGGTPLTLQEIGDRVGLSRERIRQIEARALARLREGAEADGLEAALDRPSELPEAAPERQSG
jgi:RNA polymerase primary sigma factor